MVVEDISNEVGASKQGVINQVSSKTIERMVPESATSYITALSAGTYWTFLHRALQSENIKEINIRMHALADHSGTIDIIKAPSGIDPSGTVNQSGNVGPIKVINTFALSSGSVSAIVAETDMGISSSGIIISVASGNIPVINAGDSLYAKVVATSGETVQTPVDLQMKLGL